MAELLALAAGITVVLLVLLFADDEDVGLPERRQQIRTIRQETEAAMRNIAATHEQRLGEALRRRQ